MHIAERKRLYEEVHPETKHGKVGNGREKSRQVGDSTADRFTADAVEKTGRSERTIQRDAARGSKIESLEKVVGTSLDNGNELDALAKLPLSKRPLATLLSAALPFELLLEVSDEHLTRRGET